MKIQVYCFVFVFAFAFVCIHALKVADTQLFGGETVITGEMGMPFERVAGKKIIDTSSFNKDVVVSGEMGVALGRVVEIESIVVAGRSLGTKEHDGKYLLKVLSVGNNIHLMNMPLYEFVMHQARDGRMAPDSLSLYKMKNGKDAEVLTADELRELEKDYVGKGFTLLAYETGCFEGVPKDLPSDFPLSQDAAFGFRSHLVIVRVLKEWTLSKERAKGLQEMEKQVSERNRAEQFARSANVVVDYENYPDRIHLGTYSNYKCLGTVKTTHGQIGAAIAKFTDKREMAVVILDIPMRMHANEKLRAEVDEIEQIIKAQGFKRVIFLLNSTAFGLLFYRESEPSRANQ